MYKIKPHEILHKLGFKGINEDGLAIDPNDSFMYDSVLDLIGKALSVDLNKLSSSDFDILKGISVFAKTDEEANRFKENFNPEHAKNLVETILDKIKGKEGTE